MTVTCTNTATTATTTPITDPTAPVPADNLPAQPHRKRGKGSKADAIRRMLKQGRSVNDICRKLGVTRQYVYSTRYFMNRDQGLGSIPKPVQKPVQEAVQKPVQEAVQTPPAPKPSLWGRIANWFRC